jgi:hypothetical protein
MVHLKDKFWVPIRFITYLSNLIKSSILLTNIGGSDGVVWILSVSLLFDVDWFGVTTEFVLSTGAIRAYLFLERNFPCFFFWWDGAWRVEKCAFGCFFGVIDLEIVEVACFYFHVRIISKYVTWIALYTVLMMIVWYRVRYCA